MRASVLISSIVLIFAALPAAAQSTIPGIDSTPQLSIAPAHPAPHTRATLTLQSAFYDLTRGTISWSVNGKIIATGDGLASVPIDIGAAGSALDIVATVSAPEGVASAELLVVPASVDILWEADSYTPPFYRGRALPSSGSSITLVALPHLVRAGGTKEIPSADLIYTWKSGGQILSGYSGKGKSSARIDSPLLYGRTTITVEASTVDDALTGSGLIRIEDGGPKLMLYRDHPLFGILWNQALGTTTFIPDTEMSFFAVPYFAPVSSIVSPLLQYEWHVNQASVPADSLQPNQITLSATSSSGTALVSLDLFHASNLFFSADGAWSIALNTRDAGVSGFNPFTRQ